MATIEIKPEAPWIKRSEEGVIFTDDVVGCDVELSKSSSSSSDSDKDSHDQRQLEEEEEIKENYHDGAGSDIMDGGGSEGDNDKPVMMNPAELKNLFKLDPKVQAKLAKLK